MEILSIIIGSVLGFLIGSAIVFSWYKRKRKKGHLYLVGWNSEKQEVEFKEIK